MTRVALLLAGCCLATPVWALDTPKTGGEDASVRVVPYSPLQRERLVVPENRAINITYRKDERISRVSFGQEGVFAGPEPEDLKSGLKNNLPLWAKKAGQTNMIVITQDGDENEHVYHYLMICKGVSSGEERVASNGPIQTAASDDQGDADKDAVLGLVYTYPDRDKAEKAAKAQQAAQVQRVSWQAIRARQTTEAAKAKLARDQADTARNVHYVGWGDTNIAPRSFDGSPVASDDGQNTYFRYPGAMQVPAAFVLSPDGKSEEHVAQTMQGDTLIVHTIAAEMHLRLGGAVLYVFNRAYNPIGINPATGQQADPQTGTGSARVIRTLRRVSSP